jgi:preprotein translocase subunit SecG
MEIILRVLQVFLALGLIGVVLLQRSEGGGLGIGSSGGAGSFMSVRGTANFLTRLTAILAALFMVTCLVLALLAKPNTAPKSIFDTPAPAPVTLPAIPVPAPPAQTPPASEAPALPVPVPGESPNGGTSLSPTVTPAPAVAPVAPSTPPAAIAPAAQPAPSAEKPKTKKAPQTGAAHTPGQ